jgi:hypothetical protein
VPRIAVQGCDAVKQFRKQALSGFAPEWFRRRGSSQANSAIGQTPLVFCSIYTPPSSDRLQETDSPERGDEAIGFRPRQVQLPTDEVCRHNAIQARFPKQCTDLQ